MSYRYLNNNVRGKFENDCSIRSISVATGKSWDETYEQLSDIAQYEGTMMDDRDFIRKYLSYKYTKVPRERGITVGELAERYRSNVVLITMPGHITCARYGIIFDSFDPRSRIAEDCWIVK